MVTPADERRPSMVEWAINLAQAASIRGECTRRKVGAIVLDELDRVVGVGYNGAPAGARSCLDGACPRGLHAPEVDPEGEVRCICGEYVWPCPDSVDPGSSYDTGPGSCIAIHAEANALLDAGRLARGGRLFVSEKPCDGCLRLAQGSRVRLVLWPGEKRVAWFCT